MKQYDIFISYRRTSYDTANLIATRLKAAGYSVFFDVETLRSGKFNEQLFDVIRHCKDFLLVLPPGALDRCVNEDDWVRLEVMCALENNKNIIPILLNGFQWPDPMLSGMEELKNYQALTANSIEYFDMSMERLQQKYLHSKTRSPFVKAIKVICIVALAIALVAVTLWLVLSNLSRGVCEQYASSIVKDVNAVYVIAEQNQMVMKEWAEYANAVKYSAPARKLAALRNNVSDAVQLAESNLKLSWTVDAQPAAISAYDSFLLSLNGISVQEVKLFPQYCYLYYQDYSQLLKQVEQSLTKTDTYSIDFISAWLSSQEHQFNAFYADVLSLLSEFPSKSLDPLHSSLTEWIYFPSNIKLGESSQYYQDISSNEMKLAEEVIRGYDSRLTIADAQLNDMQEQLDGLVESYESDLQAALKELEATIESTYSGLKANFCIEQGDEQWDQWAKIKRWGKFLYSLVETYQEAQQEGYSLTSSVNPQSVCREIDRMLLDFQSQFAGSLEYVASARTFFEELSQGKREYAGVLIFAINGAVQHPFFKVGDIITSYNGVKVPSLETLSSEYRKFNDGAVTVDRLTDAHFQTVTGQMTDPANVGFLDIVE